MGQTGTRTETGMLTNTEAHKLIEPFYDLFRHQRRDWDKGFAVLADDWLSYYTNELYRTKADTRSYLPELLDSIPDVNVEILHLATDGPVISVRSRLSGTPGRGFTIPSFGTPEYSGRPFSIMTIDLHRVDGDGLLSTLHHLEDWGSAVIQLGQADT